MTAIIVRGGCALHPIRLQVRGFKHAQVQILAASIALNQPIELRNVPSIKETFVLSQILRACGAHVESAPGKLIVDPRHLSTYLVPETLSKLVHGSIYLIPAFLGRLSHVQMGRTGGCRIGDPLEERARPIHHMAEVLTRFGAEVFASPEAFVATTNGLEGCDIDIMNWSERSDLLTGPLISGATKTALLASAVARGSSAIKNPYPKADVSELVTFLSHAGLYVTWNPSEIIVHPRNISGDVGLITHELISDLSVVMTYITLSVIFKLPLRVDGLTVPGLQVALEPELCVLQAMGILITWGKSSLIVTPPTVVQAVNIDVTSIGIYSDHQPLFALMLLNADGPSCIREQVWRHRFSYVAGLCAMGANLQVQEETLHIQPSKLEAGPVTVVADDLRAAVTLLIAALCIKGPCTLLGAHHLERGYEDLPGVLAKMGASIVSCTDNSDV